MRHNVGDPSQCEIEARDYPIASQHHTPGDDLGSKAEYQSWLVVDLQLKEKPKAIQVFWAQRPDAELPTGGGVMEFSSVHDEPAFVTNHHKLQYGSYRLVRHYTGWKMRSAHTYQPI